MQVYVPGPVSIWVATAAAGNNQASPQILGYGESGVQVKITPHYDSVVNDLGGNQLPFDELFMGESAIFGTMLTVLNWGLWESICMARPDPSANTPGTSAFGDLGKTMWGQKAAYSMWLRFPYPISFPAVNVGAVNGYHFFRATLVDSDTKYSTSAAKFGATFKGIRQYNYTTGVWQLYDHDMTAITANPAI